METRYTISDVARILLEYNPILKSIPYSKRSKRKKIRSSLPNIYYRKITEERKMAKAKKVKVRLFKKSKGRTIYIGKTIRKDGDSSFVLVHQKSGRKISYESFTQAKKLGWVEVK